MFQFMENLFSKQKDVILKDKLAAMLKTNPEALDAFEQSYSQYVLTQDTDSVSAKDAAQIQRETALPAYDEQLATDLIDRIVRELSAETRVLAIADGKCTSKTAGLLPEKSPPVSNEDLRKLPAPVRPQLAGNLMAVDINIPASLSLLNTLVQYQEEKNPKKKRQLYGTFRQGLDILDLDPLLYEMLGMNPNSISHWLPAISAAVAKHGFFKIPETKIAKVPMPVLQLSRLDYETLNPSTLKIVDEWAMRAFDLNVHKTYFIKTGTYSSKFDFRNAKVTGEQEVRELGEYLLFIQNQAVCMASPLNTPAIYGVSTTNEWAVREYIEDKEDNSHIYKGLPLHTEYRVFVDFDTDEILGIAPY